MDGTLIGYIKFSHKLTNKDFNIIFEAIKKVDRGN
jgi:hypothetical protein